MKSFAVKTSIRAKPSTIWAILTDAPAYPQWNSTISAIEGAIAPGQKVTLSIKANPGRAFPLKVTVFEPEKRMVWSGGMPLGLFLGQRTYTLTPGAGGEVEFSMTEEFSGLLAGMITKSIPDLQPTFNEFAACLKKKAESLG